MAILTSYEILRRVKSGAITVKPFDPGKVQQNSLDVTLGKGICVYRDTVYVPLTQRGRVDTSQDSFTISRDITPYDSGGLDAKKNNPVLHFTMDESGWLLKPGVFYLMHVEEVLCAPKLVMALDGRSSYGRLGIIVHYTAGHAETGFHGQYTLEVSAPHSVRIYPGMTIAQVIFHTVEGEIEDYQKRGNYVGEKAMGAQPSRSWKQFAT